MIYLLIGENSLAKDERIAEIRKQNLGKGDADILDIETLHSYKLNPATLKKAIKSFPIIAERRLIILRAINKLDKYNKQLLLDLLSGENNNVDIILDFDGNSKKNVFINSLLKISRCERFGEVKYETIFDIGDMIFRKEMAKALKGLYNLIEKGEMPTNLLGGLLWKWSQKKHFIPAEIYKKGLLKFQEADLNIKRTRIKPKYALEKLIVSLSQLII